jgi:ligand-binding sensor domain-containing protein
MNSNIKFLIISVLFVLITISSKSQGKQLIHFNIDSIRNDTGNFAANIIIDNDSNKWFNTRNGIFRYNNRGFNFFKLPDILYKNKKSLTIKKFVIENNHKIWVYYSYIDLNKKTGYKLMTFDSTRYFYVDTINKEFPVNIINDMKADPGDTIWIATNKGLVTMKDSIWTIYTSQTSNIPSDTIYNIELGADGIKWFTTKKGLYKYQYNIWTKYSDLNPEVIKSDRLGNLWFGAEATGYVSLRKFITDNWENYWTYSWGGGAQYKLTNIESDTINNIWFSVYDNVSVKAGSLKKMRYNSNKDWVIDNDGIDGFPPNTRVHSLMCEDNNDLWIGADNNLWIYNPAGVDESTNDINNKDNSLSLSAFPNPISNSTKIVYYNNNRTLVTIKIYDICGKEIKLLLNEIRNEGQHEIIFKNEDLASGIYFVNVTIGKMSENRKLIKQ